MSEQEKHPGELPNYRAIADNVYGPLLDEVATKLKQEPKGPIKPFPDYRAASDRAYASSMEALVFQMTERGAFNPSNDNEKKIRIELDDRIKRNLVSSRPEEGIFGVTVTDTEIPVTDVIKTFHHIQGNEMEYRGDISNGFSYFDATAEQHGISSDAVKAAMSYYIRHEEDINLYFQYQEAKKRNDPTVPKQKV